MPLIFSYKIIYSFPHFADVTLLKKCPYNLSRDQLQGNHVNSNIEYQPSENANLLSNFWLTSSNSEELSHHHFELFKDRWEVGLQKKTRNQKLNAQQNTNPHPIPNESSKNTLDEGVIALDRRVHDSLRDLRSYSFLRSKKVRLWQNK